MSWLGRIFTIPKAQRDKFTKQLQEASQSRLWTSVAKAAVAGAVGVALSGHTDPKAVGAGALTTAGAALLNFIKNPLEPTSEPASPASAAMILTATPPASAAMILSGTHVVYMPQSVDAQDPTTSPKEG